MDNIEGIINSPALGEFLGFFKRSSKLGKAGLVLIGLGTACVAVSSLLEVTIFEENKEVDDPTTNEDAEDPSTNSAAMEVTIIAPDSNTTVEEFQNV